jgi:GNAT superfamily N-acetyltransferase
MTANISAPEPIGSDHDVSQFDCGKPVLDDWLKTKALKSEGRSARCFVVCESKAVIGYYALSTGHVAHAGAPRALRQNMPDPAPVIVIGRLAVDRAWHGKGIGSHLLRDALRRILAASQHVGMRAVIVHAIDDEAVPFYAAYGFRPFPNEPRTLWLPIETIAATL